MTKKERREEILAIKKAWLLKPAVKLRRGRKPLIVTTPKPVGRNLTIVKSAPTKEQLARRKASNKRREDIKIFNNKQETTRGFYNNKVVQANLGISKASAEESKLRDIASRTRDIKAIKLRAKVSSTWLRKLSFGEKPMSDKKIAKLFNLELVA